MENHIRFQNITDFPRGTLFAMLADAYSFDPRCAECWADDWKKFDDFFFDNPHIAERCGLVTVVNGQAVGFVSWDPRPRPEYEEIGHNCILPGYQRRGYGTLQMKEAIRRIELDKPHKIVVTTSRLMVPAQKMYERAGFHKTGERPGGDPGGALLDYEYRTDVERLALENRRKAHDVIRLSRVREAWEAVGAKVNQVGSMAMGLLMTHRDIDFHIYTDSLDVEAGFAVIAQICANPNITRLEYRNLAATGEACLEWHVWYNLNGEAWQIDMIQILAGSQFDGYFEHVAERVKAVLTPETRRAILELKYLTPENEHIMGIEYYQAVIADGVRSYDELTAWRKSHPIEGISLWQP